MLRTPEPATDSFAMHPPVPVFHRAPVSYDRPSLFVLISHIAVERRRIEALQSGVLEMGSRPPKSPRKCNACPGHAASRGPFCGWIVDFCKNSMAGVQ